MDFNRIFKATNIRIMKASKFLFLTMEVNSLTISEIIKVKGNIEYNRNKPLMGVYYDQRSPAS